MKNNTYPTGLAYDDVLLKPQYSNIRSRSDIDISTDLSDNINLLKIVLKKITQKLL